LQGLLLRQAERFEEGQLHMLLPQPPLASAEARLQLFCHDRCRSCQRLLLHASGLVRVSVLS
jgi:hypothetical protein